MISIAHQNKKGLAEWLTVVILLLAIKENGDGLRSRINYKHKTRSVD